MSIIKGFQGQDQDNGGQIPCLQFVLALSCSKLACHSGIFLEKGKNRKGKGKNDFVTQLKLFWEHFENAVTTRKKNIASRPGFPFGVVDKAI